MEGTSADRRLVAATRSAAHLPFTTVRVCETMEKHLPVETMIESFTCCYSVPFSVPNVFRALAVCVLLTRNHSPRVHCGDGDPSLLPASGKSLAIRAHGWGRREGRG